ncbi:hypothetical protein FHS03_005053 [Massilia violacea]|uniref:Uncharacterized protein n=1 Tax=Pseudoduganella violacea TaxID=1715466 RepID=A0A7W5FX67_9BURK|nr:hypothetical protein [Pseudoduganella violacea]
MAEISNGDAPQRAHAAAALDERFNWHRIRRLARKG